MVKLIEEPLEKRSFADWSMGYSEVTRSELASIPGLNDFFFERSSFEGLEAGRAKALLAAFRDGKWRSKACHRDGHRRSGPSLLGCRPGNRT